MWSNIRNEFIFFYLLATCNGDFSTTGKKIHLPQQPTWWTDICKPPLCNEMKTCISLHIKYMMELCVLYLRVHNSLEKLFWIWSLADLIQIVYHQRVIKLLDNILIRWGTPRIPDLVNNIWVLITLNMLMNILLFVMSWETPGFWEYSTEQHTVISKKTEKAPHQQAQNPIDWQPQFQKNAIQHNNPTPNHYKWANREKILKRTLGKIALVNNNCFC